MPNTEAVLLIVGLELELKTQLKKIKKRANFLF